MLKKTVSGLMLTLLLISMLTLAFNVQPVRAWDKSHDVAVIDDYYGPAVGYMYPSDYPGQAFSTLSASQVSAETLANHDTVILFMFNPNGLTAAQKDAINDWIYKGGKLIIWDSDSVSPGSPWDYTWLPHPFTTSVPGQMGAVAGHLEVIEENELSSSDPNSPYYIDTSALTSQTDAVGDANILVTYSPGWHIDMMATNVLGETGPAHVYAGHGLGLIIYSALDWNYAGYNYASGAWLKKMLRQELECSYLPFAAPTVPEEVGLMVDITPKTEGPFHVGDTIEFEVTVTNPTDSTGINVNAESIKLTIMEPEEIQIFQPGGGISVADIGLGESRSTTFYGEAKKAGANVRLTVNALGRTSLGYIGGRGSCTISIDRSIGAPPQPDWSFATITDIHIGYNSYRWDSDYDGYEIGEIDYAGSGVQDSLQGRETEDYEVTRRLESSVNRIIAEKDPYSIKFVVVLGDISDTAEKSEFLKAREILDRLNDPNEDGDTSDGVPYIVIFGNHDTWPYAQDVGKADNRDRYSWIWPSADGDKFFREVFWSESNNGNLQLIKNLFGDTWESTTNKVVPIKAGWWGECCSYTFQPDLDDGNLFYSNGMWHKEPASTEHDYYFQNYGFVYDGITFVCLDLAARIGEDFNPANDNALPGILEPVGGIFGTRHRATVDFAEDYIERHKATEKKEIVFFSHNPIVDFPLKPVSGYKIYNFFGHVHVSFEFHGDPKDMLAGLAYHMGSTNPELNNYYWAATEDTGRVELAWIWSVFVNKLKGVSPRRDEKSIRIVQFANGNLDWENPIMLEPAQEVEIRWPFPDFAYPYASLPEPNKAITFTGYFTTYHGFKTSFDWDFGDGSYGSGSSTTHSYAQEGEYTVTLTVTTRNLVTSEERSQTAIGSVHVHSKHIILPLPSELNANSWLTGEDLTYVPENTHQPTLITKSASGQIPIAEFGVHFEEATGDIDLSSLVADANLEEGKSVIYMPTWPEEIDQYKQLLIPSTGAGMVYICLDATSLGDVSLENADVTLNVGETKDGITATTTFYNGREYYLVSGVTGTGGGELKDTIPPTTTLTIGEPKYVTDITYVTPDTLFNLTATDNPGGTGVALTAYKIRNAAYNSGWLTYTQPFHLTGLADGIYFIDYNSTDNANNVEPTNTINVTLFSWNYIFEDTYGRGTILKINLAHKFFQFITPDKDYGIRNATYMRMCGRAIIIKHCDRELRLITVAIDTKLDLCVANAWDVITCKRYFLLDKPGIEK